MIRSISTPAFQVFFFSIILALSFSGNPLHAQSVPPEEAYFNWTDLPFSPGSYHQRRTRLVALLRQNGGGLYISPSLDGLSHGETFRQADDFLYFTGLEFPQSILVVDSDQDRTILFVPDRDFRFENPSRRNDFPGRPLGKDPELARRTGIGDIRPIGRFEEAVAEWTRQGRLFRINQGRGGNFTPVQSGYLSSWTPEQTLGFHLQQTHPGVRIQNAFEEIATLRMIKSGEEIAVLKQAAAITCSGIRRAARFVRGGVDERTLEAELEAEFKRLGAQRVAFHPIIKSGPNSLWPWRILAAQYDRRNRRMANGELVIFDVGCEFQYYCSDVGRTFPVSGRFTPEQKRILRMETAVSDAILAAVRPGIRLADLQQAGIAVIPPEERPYMQVGLFFGHHIGLSSGDPSLPDAVLQPGMVFTVEPWYYNHNKQIAVFTEDVVLVTETGAEVLTASLPRTPEELEKMVRRKP